MAKRRERSTNDLIRELRAGTIAGKQISKPQRQACVERLELEGVSRYDIEDMFCRAARTIRRDLEDIRARNAMYPSPNLEAEVMGEYRVQVEAAVAKLSRLYRDPAASVADKISATNSAIAIHDRFIERLSCVGLIGGGRSEHTEIEQLAELIQTSVTISAELGDSSQLSIELRALIASMATKRKQSRNESRE